MVASSSASIGRGPLIDEDAMLAKLPRTKVAATWVPWSAAKLAYAEYVRLVQPVVAKVSDPRLAIA